MNLHSVAAGAIQAINGFVLADIKVSNGYETQADGVQASTYQPIIPDVPIQIQALPQNYTFLKHARSEYMSLQETIYKIYISKRIDGLVRVSKKGGDLIYPKQGVHKGKVFLVTTVLEHWSDWTCVIVNLQNGS